VTPILAAGFLGIEHFTPPWDVFFLPLFNLLIALYQILFNDFALAIIVFTIVIRFLVAPLFNAQIRSQKEMQRMQPLVRELQRKHKGNRQKIAEETMALYREHGVNQFGGCLPLLIQLPFLLALYQALIRASNVVTLTTQQVATDTFTQLKAALPGIVPVAGSSTQFNAPVTGSCALPQFGVPEFSHFLPLNCQLIDPLKLLHAVNTKVAWLGGLDLARPDHVFAIIIPGLGFGLSLIAVLTAILQFIQVRMTSPRANPDDPTAAATSTMTYLFPFLTVFWGGIFPSGLILYYLVYTAFLVVQQYFIMGWGNLFPLFGWQPAWAPATVEPAPRPRRRDDDSDATRDQGTDGDRSAATPRPSTPRPPQAGQRPVRKGGKRRGRKR
jgi:YidC/Oxa1 family membrane protein insertase